MLESVVSVAAEQLKQPVTIEEYPLMNDGDYRAAQFREVIDAAPVAMLVVNGLGKITVANKRAAEVFRYPIDQLVGSDVDELVAAQYRSGHRQRMENFFRDQVPRVMGVGREVIAVDSFGREFPVEIGLNPILSPDGPLVVAAIIDITERKRREKESTLARLVQEAMLPQIPRELPGLQLAASSEPADATGGDFYDLIRFPDERIGIVIGDASGHGFAAALVTATARSYLRALSKTESDLSRIMTKANLLLIDDLLESRFVTLLFVLFDVKKMELSYAGAGHIGYLLDSSGRLRQRLDQTGPPLGWFEESEYPLTTISLEHGDLFVLLTDGIEEAMNPDGKQFGAVRVQNLLQQISHDPVDRIVSQVHQSVHEFQEGKEPHDDATVIIGRVL
jgi:PAS domain S-box-containing protein